jgi:DNA-binding CsgD family transcriptional regulator
MATGPGGERDEQALGAAASAFYADLRLTPVLRQVLKHSDELLGGAAGSISLVEPSRDRYVKAAERGASCRLGRRFPLDEGVTGQVVARRAPVLLKRYADLPTGHLPAERPESQGPVAAVPIWWRGEVIGVNVLFAGRRGPFTVAQVEELELLTQVAAAAIVRAGTGDPSLAHLLRRRARAAGPAGVTTTVTEVGPVRPVSAAVAGVALELLGLAEATAARREPAARLHVAVMHGPDGLRLLLQDEHAVDRPAAEQRSDGRRAGPSPREPGGPGDPTGTGARSWEELVVRAGGGVTVERVPGWGTLVRADLPYDPPLPAPPAEASPLSPRETEVLGLLARGLSDREIAEALVLSPKTVEKHVAAVRRKAGARTRTAAVTTALAHGWLPPEDRPA